MRFNYATGGIALFAAFVLCMLVLDDHPCVEPDGSIRPNCEATP